MTDKFDIQDPQLAKEYAELFEVEEAIMTLMCANCELPLEVEEAIMTLMCAKPLPEFNFSLQKFHPILENMMNEVERRQNILNKRLELKHRKGG